MKAKIIFTITAYCILIIAAIFFSWTDRVGNVWVVSVLVMSLAFLLAYLILSILTYLARLTAKSYELLNKPAEHSSFLWFKDETALERNYSLVKRKFDLSADYIASIGHYDNLGTMDDLVKNDSIGVALVKISQEIQALKEEEDKRNWIAQGLAKFSEILRNKGEIKEYTYQILGKLVKYMGANQGSLFIEYENKEEGRFLELTACYAYESQKHVDSKVFIGQGLLGQCMQEKDFIFLTDVPEDYVKITSGLGEAAPRNIVVAPLVINEKFYGAIELALFHVVQPHHMEFLKKVCENIASEIASIRTFEHTEHLLEESKSLTQELQEGQEEMKQNLEELAATHEEMDRKQIELSGIMNAVDSTLAMVELDTSGKIIKNNFSFEEFLGFNSNQLLQKDFRLLIGNESEVSWKNILEGVINSGDFKTTSKQDEVIWLSITFTPVKDQSELTQKILCMIQNITQRKIKEKEYQRLSLVADNTDNSVIITDKNGLIEYVNEGFIKVTGYKASEVIGKQPGAILQGPLTDKNTIKKLSEQIKAGVPIYEEILNYNKKKESYWVSLAINPVRNDNGEIDKYISVQADITDTKNKALDSQQKITALSTSNAIIEIDMLGKIIEANDNYLELLGYERSDLIGKPYSILTNKENTFQEVLDTISENGLQDGVFNRYDKNGRSLWLKLMDYPVMNIRGELEKIIEFGVDVSNEKRLEREAARKQAELNGYLNGVNNTIASAEFDLNGNFVTGNELFLTITGYVEADIKGANYKQLMSTDEGVEMMWENLKVGKYFSGEYKIKSKEGQELWLNGTFNPIILNDGKPEKIMMFAQFTTQEKERLNDLTVMVHALKNTLPVLEFNDQFVCKTANEKFLKTFGLTKLTLRNKTIHDFINPSYRDVFDTLKPEILRKDFTSLQLPMHNAENIDTTYEASVSVARKLDGSISRIILLLAKESDKTMPMLMAV